MPCTHLIIYQSSTGHHYCGHCGVHLAITGPDAEPSAHQRAVDTLIGAARMFTKVTRSRRKDLYPTAFRVLEEAARGLDPWHDEPVLPNPPPQAGPSSIG